MSEHCTFSRGIPWKGHTAMLRYDHCRNRTNHPSRRCWLHLPEEDWTARRDAREAARQARARRALALANHEEG